MTDFIESVINAIEAGRGVTLATIVGPASMPQGMLGRKLVVHPDGRVDGTLGVTSLDERVGRELQDAGPAASPRLVSLPLTKEEASSLGVEPNTSIQIFLDVMTPPPTLLIVGSGHVAQPVSSIGKTLGFRVVVLDDRESFANRERFPDADQILVGEFSQELPKFPIHPATYVIIVTRGHAYDEGALRSVVGSRAAYIGMIGSARKVRTVLDNLASTGIPQEQLDRVYSPIGLDIGAETPAEIALSIMAEIVNVRRRGRRSPCSMSEQRRRGGMAS